MVECGNSKQIIEHLTTEGKRGDPIDAFGIVVGSEIDKILILLKLVRY